MMTSFQVTFQVMGHHNATGIFRGEQPLAKVVNGVRSTKHVLLDTTAFTFTLWGDGVDMATVVTSLLNHRQIRGENVLVDLRGVAGFS